MLLGAEQLVAYLTSCHNSVKEVCGPKDSHDSYHTCFADSLVSLVISLTRAKVSGVLCHWKIPVHVWPIVIFLYLTVIILSIVLNSGLRSRLRLPGLWSGLVWPWVQSSSQFVGVTASKALGQCIPESFPFGLIYLPSRIVLRLMVGPAFKADSATVVSHWQTNWLSPSDKSEILNPPLACVGSWLLRRVISRYDCIWCPLRWQDGVMRFKTFF